MKVEGFFFRMDLTKGVWKLGQIFAYFFGVGCAALGLKIPKKCHFISYI